MPVFTTIAWQDGILGSRPTELLTELQVPYHAIVSNGHHQLFYGAVAEALGFLDLYLKGQGEPPASPITVWWETRVAPFPRFAAPAWTSGLGAWPPPQAKTQAFALRSGGRLVEGPGEGAPDAYVAALPGQGQTSDIVTGLVTPESLAPIVWGAPRADGSYLSYTTDAFERDLVVVGSASLDVWLSSSAPDTDVQATLTEVRPNGEEVFVQHGWLRASHRALDDGRSTVTRPYHPHTVEALAPLTPGVPEALRVEILPFGHVFREGSRLRLTIESPKAVPDMYGFASLPAPVNLVHHDATHPSRLVLSVLPGRTARADPPRCDEPAVR